MIPVKYSFRSNENNGKTLFVKYNEGFSQMIQPYLEKWLEVEVRERIESISFLFLFNTMLEESYDKKLNKLVARDKTEKKDNNKRRR